MDAGRRSAVLGAAAVLAGLLVVAGCARGNRSAPQWEAAPIAVGSPLALPTAGETASPTASPTPAPASATAKPTRTAKPAPVQPSRDIAKAPKEVPPPPPPPKPNCSPSYSGANASKGEVKGDLDKAATVTFWKGVAKAPPNSQENTVPKNLLYAVAWQESGWQSAIVACDGGIGTMQVMPDTAEFLNRRFGTPYAMHTLDGNVMLGGEYLAWLVGYFGSVYYQGNYDLTVQAAPGSVSLLDSVISAYNYGFGAVEPDKGEAGIPNWQYVINVEALMTNCPCSSS